MSPDQEFDELAREKLEGRSIPFAEADWQDARSRIDAARGRRGRPGAWILGGGLLLVIGSLWWVGAQQYHPEGSVALHAPQQEALHVTAPAASPLPVAAHAPLPVAPPAGTATRAQASAGAINMVTVPEPAPNARPLPEQLPASDLIQAERWKPERNDPGSTARQHALLFEVPTPVEIESVSTPTATIADTDALSTDGDLPVSDEAPSAPFPAPTNSAAAATMTQLPQESVEKAVPAAYTPEASPASGEAQVNADRTVPDTAAPVAAAVLPADSLPGPVLPAAPMDSSAAAPPAIAPPLVPTRAPWEISLAGGLFQGQGRYTGAQSADWAGDVSGARSAGAGVELMHMGRHIGLGLGLHYGNYAERIRTDAIDVRTSTTHSYWYLMPVDTTVLLITDTVPGQPPSYTGTSIDTTVHVLAQGNDTVVSVQHRRDARDQVNRVSYLEVPLLLDVHVTQGRWMLGLRGGPTIGLLTGRRGSLPNNTDDGYLGFNDVAFREVVFGYTARAYVRYRFNAGWSVGVEPALRGQLLNSLSSGELERRSSAKGVMISLTYRLR